MSENKKSIWNEVITNVISTVVATLFVGAGIIVWDAASTMDQKINQAKSDLHEQQNSITGTQEILKKELASLKASVEILEDRQKVIQTRLFEANKIILEHTKKKDNKKNLSTYFYAMPSELPMDLNELENKNLDRLDKLLEQYRLK